ncbi:hypothetical protein QZH41_016101, partial [Actinostola sp. cb2023]
KCHFILLEGLLRGATRGVLTGKKGNKQFYKGRGVRPPGYHTSKGGYKIVQRKVPEFIVPDLTGFEVWLMYMLITCLIQASRVPDFRYARNAL